MVSRFVAVALASFALLVAGESQSEAAGGAVAAVPTSIEIAAPPAAYGTNTSALYLVVADEIRALAPAKGPHRSVVVSITLAPPTEAPTVECAVDATLRDEKTGAVLSVLQTATRAEGPLDVSQRKALAHAAVRRIVRRVPGALAEAN